MESSLAGFKMFLPEIFPQFKGIPEEALFLPPEMVTEEVCLRFRDYLVEKHSGETPANYFGRFKKMMAAAKKKGYYRTDPSEDIKKKNGKTNRKKEVLTLEEFKQLCRVPCSNPEVKKAFLFSLLTGIRGQSVRSLKWEDVKDNDGEPYITIIQEKTGKPVDVPILEEALTFLPRRRGKPVEKVFLTPSSTNGYNKVIKGWMEDAGIEKHITGHCARHSMGTILKASNLSDLFIADILGHTTTKYVGRYSRDTDLKRKREGLKAAFGSKDGLQP